MANIKAALRYSEHWKPAAELKVLAEQEPSESLHLSNLQSILPGGLKRGRILEIYGSRSAGRMSICLHILALATALGETCAVVDALDAFDPASAAAAGVHLEHLVWVRCGGHLEHALRAADLLLHAGGFGAVTLDLCEANPRGLNRIPLSYWHRFRQALENTATTLLVCGDSAQAKSTAYSNIQTKVKAISWLGNAPFSRLAGLEIQAASPKVLSIRPQSVFLAA